MTSSNLAACVTGRSAGLAPLRIRPAVDPAMAKRIRNVGSVAHQPADLNKVAGRENAAGIARRDAKLTNWARRLFKKGDSRLTMRASGRSRTKVAKAASISRLVLGVEDLDLQPHGATSRFRVSQRGLGSGGED